MESGVVKNLLDSAWSGSEWRERRSRSMRVCADFQKGARCAGTVCQTPMAAAWFSPRFVRFVLLSHRACLLVCACVRERGRGGVGSFLTCLEVLRFSDSFACVRCSFRATECKPRAPLALCSNAKAPVCPYEWLEQVCVCVRARVRS